MILVVAHRPPYAGNHNLDTNSLPSKTGREFRGRPLLLPHLEFLLNRPETGKTVRSYKKKLNINNLNLKVISFY
jgi:hypothetical protein